MKNKEYSTLEKNFEFLNATKRMELQHREGIYNSALTIAGGALILSISFLEYFSFNRETIYILKFSWLLLGISIIMNILTRYFFTEIGIINVYKEIFKFENSQMPINEFFEKYKPEKRYVIFVQITFRIFWFSFIGGLLVLIYFALINT